MIEVGTRNVASLRLVLQVALLTGILAIGGHAYALPEFLDTAKTVYSFKSGGKIDGKSCDLCHAGATNANSLNPYGKEIKAALKAAPGHKLTADVLHSLDSSDSDGDGFPNDSEFKADTLPGDPASKPAGSPPTAVKAAPKPEADDNPWSLKALLYPDHAQHPIVVHFPIGLFVFSFILDIIAMVKKSKELYIASYINLVASAVTSFASVVSGLIAWRVAFRGEALSADPYLRNHLILGIVTTLLICVLCGIRSRNAKNPEQPLPGAYLPLAFVTFIVIAITGHLGGIISGVVK